MGRVESTQLYLLRTSTRCIVRTTTYKYGQGGEQQGKFSAGTYVRTYEPLALVCIFLKRVRECGINIEDMSTRPNTVLSRRDEDLGEVALVW